MESVPGLCNGDLIAELLDCNSTIYWTITGVDLRCNVVKGYLNREVAFMMLDPKSYVKEFKNSSFDELKKERERLYKELRAIERVAFEKEHVSEDWQVLPGPGTRYQMYLEYMAALCELMSKKYREEIAWGKSEN